QYGFPKTIPYLFDYVYQSDISELFNSGADGVICNDGTAVIAWNAAILFSGANPPFSISYQAIANAVAAVQSRNDIRLATAADNPFQPKGESYALYRAHRGRIFTLHTIFSNRTASSTSAADRVISPAPVCPASMVGWTNHVGLPGNQPIKPATPNSSPANPLQNITIRKIFLFRLECCWLLKRVGS
ncbi:MAG: hypothetical protein JWO95_3720, partial [Verrucomicrobiales bacterium]|nr:hypothetical protein [Verrucomicrobiales bacterium]